MNYKSLSKVLRYSGPTSEEDFHKLLDENPHDHQTRMILADYLQDKDDPRAEGYRALGQLQRYPQLSTGAHFFHSPSYEHISLIKRRAPNSILPEEWFNLIDNNNYGGLTHEMTRKDMEDEAALAFGKLAPEVKEKILKGEK